MSKHVRKGPRGQAKVTLENRHKRTIWNYRPDGSKKVVVIHKKPEQPARPIVIQDRRPHFLDAILTAQILGNAVNNDYREARVREREWRVSRREYELALREEEVLVKETLNAAFATEKRVLDILKEIEAKLSKV